jgi:hypothetical protein
MDAREDSYIQELIKMIADLRQESYKQLQRIEALEKDGVAIRLNPGVTIQGPAILRTRIKSEQQPQQSAGTDHAGWHRLSDVKPLNGAQCLFRVHPNLLHSRGVWVDQSHSLTPSISPSGFYTDLGLFVGDPALIWWSAIEPEAQQPAPATEESSATAPPAPAGVQRRYPSPATIAECGGPCDSQGHEACDCGLLQELNPPSPAPAGELVERLSHLLANRFSESSPGTDCTPLARDVLREIAKWLRSDGPDWPSVASLLEQEANQ